MEDKSFSENDKSLITSLYDDRFDLMGHSPKTVGWGSKTDQELRFRMLFKELNLEGKTILDIGCGLGDLVEYIELNKTKNFKYYGLDISKKFIKYAKDKYVNPNINFINGELTSLFNLNKKSFILPNIDICVISGLFNFKIKNNQQYLEENIARLFNLVSECLSINFLSLYVDYQEEKNFHYKPEYVFSLAKNLSKYVVLYHDYPLWEFTVQLRHKSKYE